MGNKWNKSLNNVRRKSQLSKGQNENSVGKKTLMVRDENGVLVSHPTVNSGEGKLLKIDLKYNQKRGRDFCINYSPYFEKSFSSLRPSYRRSGRYGS